MKAGIMPPPCYCIHTRRPLYPRELQELAIRLRMSNTALDGRYVVFYNRRETDPSSATPRLARGIARRSPPPPPADGRIKELIDSLRMLGIEQPEAQIRSAMTECYPGGLPDDFEMALTTVFRHLRRLDRAR